MALRSSLNENPASKVPFAPSANAPRSDVQDAIKYAADAAATAQSLAAGALVAANNLSDLANAATARGNLGLGTSATKDVPATGNASSTQVVEGSDTRLSDARAPTAHAASHAAAGSDPVAISATQVSGLAPVATSGSAADLSKGTLSAARLPAPTTGALGGVKSLAAVSHKFLTSIDTSGNPVAAQPAAGDISGLAAVATSGSATDLTTGALPAARMPALTGDVTTVAGAVATSIAAGKVVRVDGAQGLSSAVQQQGRANIYAAPLDALAYLDIIINGEMKVSQENGTNNITLTGSASVQTKYLVDQWMAVYRGSFVATAAQVTDAPPNYDNSIKITVGTAEASIGTNDELSLNTPIEGFRTSRLAFGGANAKTSNICFWVKAHRTGAYSGSVRNVAVGGASPQSYPFSFTIAAADTWQFVTVSLPGDTSGTWGTGSSVGAYLNIAIAAGASRVSTANAFGATDASGVTSTTNGVAATTDVFHITGVSWLPGTDAIDAADPWRLQRHFSDELKDCQRYFLNPSPSNSGAWGASTTSITVTVVFGVTMRVAPTVVLVNGSVGTGSALEISVAQHVVSAITATSFTTAGGRLDLTTTAAAGTQRPAVLEAGTLSFNARM